MRAVLKPTFFAITLMMTSALSQAQTSGPPTVSEAAPSASLFGPSPFGSLDTRALFAQQPAGPPPTPRHTGIKTMAKHLVTNFKYLPSMENLYWAGAGGGLALVAHPFDDNVNEALVGNDTAEKSSSLERSSANWGRFSVARQWSTPWDASKTSRRSRIWAWISLKRWPCPRPSRKA